MTLSRQTPHQGTVVATKDLRGGQTRKRSQEAIRQLQKATRHEMVADMADWDGDTHTVSWSAGTRGALAKRQSRCSSAWARPGACSRARARSRFWIATAGHDPAPQHLYGAGLSELDSRRGLTATDGTGARG
jgi:hypothetical protein